MTQARNPKILFVDDDEDFRTITTTRLKAAGYDVLEAASEVEAMKIIARENFDLALVDLMMEHEDSGFIIAYKMSRSKPDIPVVIISSLTSKTGVRVDLAQAGDAGWLRASTMLQKGSRFDILDGEIRRLLSERKDAK